MWALNSNKKPKIKTECTLSLDKYVENKRKEFEEERAEIPRLESVKNNLSKEVDKMTETYQFRQKNDFIREIQTLTTEIETRKSKQRDNEYEKSVTPYMQAYRERVQFTQSGSDDIRNISVPGSGNRRKETIDSYAIESDATTKRQNEIVNEYLSNVGIQAPKINVNTRDDCTMCGNKLLLLGSKSIMICNECGYSVSYLDATVSNMSYNDEIEFASFSYKRINHFNEWLQLVQAKESYEVPNDVLDKVMHELYKQRINDIENITPQKIRDILKTLKIRKAYDHVVQIHSKITGIKPSRMTPEMEDTCRLMFIAVQPVFEKYCPKERKNFLSYSYCLYKFFQILGLYQFLDCFSLLKGRDKLAKQDDIFRQICDDLNWEFFPSV